MSRACPLDLDRLGGQVRYLLGMLRRQPQVALDDPGHCSLGNRPLLVFSNTAMLGQRPNIPFSMRRERAVCMALSDGGGAMSDYPRFEPVKGPPDATYQNYYGGPAVKLLFLIVDLWTGRPKGRRSTPVLDPATGPIEIHESRSPAGSALDVAAHAQTLHRLSPEETFSPQFLVSSARTKTLQVGILAGFIAVLVVIVAQGLPWRQQLTGHGMQSKALKPPRC